MPKIKYPTKLLNSIHNLFYLNSTIKKFFFSTAE